MLQRNLQLVVKEQKTLRSVANASIESDKENSEEEEDFANTKARTVTII
ncbi:11815_t:CDS:2 [Ambispora leptoticha]|uniref:11815_t:CDS:1 n=1 Tax=Ambispora leptoticha TaxID=144679 RepID=A0A9N9F5I7_9GLOM|nr:11815_t:CDS:2 [Ambispora leptoticha]